MSKWGIRAVHPEDFLLGLYAKHPDAIWRQLKLAADKKSMRLDEFVPSYSPQLSRFKAALLADLR